MLCTLMSNQQENQYHNVFQTSLGVAASYRCSHYYTNFTGGGRFGFPAVGKAVRRGLEATVNRGLTAVGGFARRG